MKSCTLGPKYMLTRAQALESKNFKARSCKTRARTHARTHVMTSLSLVSRKVSASFLPAETGRTEPGRSSLVGPRPLRRRSCQRKQVSSWAVRSRDQGLGFNIRVEDAHKARKVIRLPAFCGLSRRGLGCFVAHYVLYIMPYSVIL